MIRIFLALSSAVLLTLSFPTFDINFLAWFGLAPLFLAIKDQSLKSTLGLSFLSGIAFFMSVFYWINFVDGIKLHHYIIFGVYLGLYFVVFAFLLHLVRKGTKFPFIITAPALWVGIEYLRSHAGFMSLPWALLGHSQYSNLPLIQMCSITGAYGISFIVVLVNSAIADFTGYWIEKRQQGDSLDLRNPPVLRGIVVLSILLILLIAGWMSLPSTPSGKSLSVSVVQGNIPQEMKWKREYREQIISKYEILSEEASKFKPQLVVWPEASTPGFILNDMILMQRMVAMVQRFRTYLLAGSAEYPKFGKKPKRLKSGNTALFFSPEGKILGQYVKIYLLPFGEYVPYEGVFPWPEFVVPRGMNSDLAGTDLILFGVDGTKFGTPICSEIMYPDLSRCMVKKGANFLVNISNEAWFGKSAFPYQALSISVFRAVENRVNVVRSTNTGVSGFIDPYGRIVAKLNRNGEEIFIEGTLAQNILLSTPGTFYTLYGDILAYGCIAFSGGLVVWVLLRRRSNGPRP